MNNTAITVRDFSLPHTLFCGQAFRWEETDGGFSAIAHGRRLVVRTAPAPCGDSLTLEGVTQQEFNAVWRSYFDLDRDYGEVCEQLARYGGDVMKEALAYAPGLRVLRQEPWEVLISFILSQNANIPRIRKMVSALCEGWGRQLPCGGYAFPTARALAGLSAEELAPVRAGYRAGYILDAARRVAEGSLPLDALTEEKNCEVIRGNLLAVHGVGPKVADCVLLYGFGRVEIYPADVWIRRAMARYFPHGFPPEIAHIAGLAQQYLFHYIRNAKNP